MKPFKSPLLALFGLIFMVQPIVAQHQVVNAEAHGSIRQCISINQGWRFYKYESLDKADHLIYDIRPEIKDNKDNKEADAKPTEAVKTMATQEVLKPWILPSGNEFIKDPSKRHVRPEGNPGINFPFVMSSFDDSSWEELDLPHDWSIKGPFMKGGDAEVGGGMGRLPSNGVAWYRKKLDIPLSDAGKSVFLDIDGAMSYAMVWLNGHLVGGWPYGYNSWRLDLTPFMVPGGDNQLAIRLDNPNYSARWYPGGGIYRNVWLTKTSKVYVGHWGTFVTTHNVSKASATINLAITIDNDTQNDATVEVITHIYKLDENNKHEGKAVTSFATIQSTIPAGGNTELKGSVNLKNPKLWGPVPTQKPNLYVAVTI